MSDVKILLHKKDGAGFVPVASSDFDKSFSAITGKPTTLSGYGITDAASLTHTHSFSSLTGKPTTLSGYGIIDAQPKDDALIALAAGSDFVKFVGPTSTVKSFTLPNENAVLARVDAPQTFLGTQEFNSILLQNSSSFQGGAHFYDEVGIHQAINFGGDCFFLESATFTYGGNTAELNRNALEVPFLNGPNTFIGAQTFSGNNGESGIITLVSDDGGTSNITAPITGTNSGNHEFSLPASNVDLIKTFALTSSPDGSINANEITTGNLSIARIANALAGSIVLGSGTGQTISINSKTVNSLIPSVTNSDDLGSSSLKYRNIYLSGTGSQLGTPASGNFASGTFTWPTFNQNTTGNAATVTSIGNLTGIVTSINRVTSIEDGAISINKVYELQDILDYKIDVGGPISVSQFSDVPNNVINALVKDIGTNGSILLFNGAAGTPSSLVGTNITGTATGLTAGSANTLVTSRTIGGSSFNGSANVTSFPSPGPIGGTTPNTGSFTTLNCSTFGCYTVYASVGIVSDGPVTIANHPLRISTAKTPASSSATGSTGQICWDADYIYVCVSTNTWKRTAISTW